MKTFLVLQHLTTEQLHSERSELYRLHTSEELTDVVRDAAAVLTNFYGAELDARIMGERGSK